MGIHPIGNRLLWMDLRWDSSNDCILLHRMLIASVDLCKGSDRLGRLAFHRNGNSLITISLIAAIAKGFHLVTKAHRGYVASPFGENDTAAP